ncbi:hypothetical protein QBC38DRAFT_471979 [Podospora fimiseda]|uniref:Uncharacterized protein n=1 Tax=Podospora fimiseda TaxID=252190 RepID=A0AAN7GY07_9PEZI|nr:hypothetical protein QBC38DRAFT_471979 [Podospora fimiseda]
MYLTSALLLTGLAAASPLQNRQAAAVTSTSSVVATPTPIACPSNSTTTVSISPEIIQQIMPTSNSCDPAQSLPEDCRTAEQAAPFISKSSEGLTPAEIAGTLALMGLESADLKFKHNVFPGRPGQGTAGMLMPNFVGEYATSVFGTEAVAEKGGDVAAILEMVVVDEHNFGSVRWFYESKCDAGVKEQLKKGTDEGFKAYMGCVGVDGGNADRLAYWERAKTAFKL